MHCITTSIDNVDNVQALIEACGYTLWVTK